MLTKNTQPAILAHSVAVMEVLKHELEWELTNNTFSSALGHSLGEFSALACSGSLTLEDAARLVRLRGAAMQEAVPEGKGSMVALLNITSESDIANALLQFNKEQDSPHSVCDIANINSNNQLVISGETIAVLKFANRAKDMKLCRRTVTLPVSAPFHCALLHPAAAKLKEALSLIPIRSPLIPVIANVTADIVRFIL